jgi:hypothetical protein
MKTNMKYVSIAALGLLFSMSACSKTEQTPVVVYEQQDQVARPAINTVFNDAAHKDAFNTTIPSLMGPTFAPMFNAHLLALNTGYSTNLLTQSSTAFTTLLATDVLNVNLAGTTTFYDGTNVLTGRKLDDNVIKVELILIFGGPSGSDNPGLSDDHVDANDHAFLSTFPYLAVAN